MVIIKFSITNFIFVLSLWLFCVKAKATTHWVVTENGRIQSQVDSPFHLRRPYDLIALLDQETRRTNITLLYNEMHKRKNVIDKKWLGIEGATEVEARIYSQDSYCLQAGKLLSDVDLYSSIASNGSDRIEIPFGVNDTSSDNYSIPDCTTYSSVPYSMCAFEHLHAMLERSGLSIPQETNLNNLLPVDSVDAFGHGVSLELQKNTTSWVHYNLAMFYWRIKGNAYNAIECGRRALHFVSRQYRDIPLLTLADVLHQSQHPKDAAVLLHAALRHSPDTYLNYIALGNTYAVQYDYNRSIACYDIALNKNPDLESIAASKYALLCHKNLDEGLMKLHDSLQTILTELHDYHGLQQQWLRLQERLLWEQTPFDMQSIGFNTEKHSTGQRCIQRKSFDDSQPRITCDYTERSSATKYQADATLNFQKLLHNVETETKKISEQIARSKNLRAAPTTRKWNGNNVNKLLPKVDFDNADDDSVGNMPQVLHPMYPLTLSPSRNLYFDSSGWPSTAQCAKWDLPLTEHDDLDVPVFLPPENKGYQVSKMLTDYIGLPDGKEHNLPWHPPVCNDGPRDVEKFYLPSTLRQLTNGAVLKNHPLLKEHFLNYVNSGKTEESEIGQRIVTAMQKKAGPEWVLATLASLYWRVRLNTKNALNCLDLAFQTVSKGNTDVILVSIGSILYQLGLINEATKYAKLAFKVNFYEPSTNFLLAMVHYRSNNPILAMYYMKNVLRIEPDYYDGKANELLRTWACRLKMGAYEDLGSESDKPDKDLSSCSGGNDECNKLSYCQPTDKDRQCSAKRQVSLSQAVLSNLIANEALRDAETVSLPRPFHMKVTLESADAALGDFYIFVSLSDDAIPEPILTVQDTSGLYALSASTCLEMKDIDWYLFDIKWQSTASRNINIKHLLSPFPINIRANLRPECAEPDKPLLILDRLAKVLKKPLRNVQEEALFKWLGTMAGNETATLSYIGTQIFIGFMEHKKSWLLSTAAAYYWRIIGDSSKAMTCLKQALVYVPNDMKDIPLISMSYIFQSNKLYSEALEIASLALESNPNYVINHFTVGNIHAAKGNLEKALSFYHAALALDAKYIPAQIRIKELLCSLLFDDNGVMKDVTNIE